MRSCFCTSIRDEGYQAYFSNRVECSLFRGFRSNGHQLVARLFALDILLDGQVHDFISKQGRKPGSMFDIIIIMRRQLAHPSYTCITE